MKKTLLSIAFLAASGAYVAAANHVFVGLTPLTVRPHEAPATAVDTAVPAPPARAPTVAPATAATSEPPAAQVASRPAQVATVPQSAVTAMTVTATAPKPTKMPPLPRPRPADAPSLQSAQARTDVAANGGPYRDGSYTGTDENAYYGRVQVQVTVASGQITAVKAVDYPSDRRTSRYINSQALPLLQQEVVQAQNADVDTVSGATLTSEAYIRSLKNALTKAGGSNA